MCAKVFVVQFVCLQDMGMSCKDIDLNNVTLPTDCEKPSIVDIEWLLKQHSRKTFVFNILSVGKDTYWSFLFLLFVSGSLVYRVYVIVVFI